MRFSKLDELLSTTERFSIEMETISRIDVNHKLLLGTHRANEIDSTASTLVKYSYIPGGNLHASYLLHKKELFGVNVYEKIEGISTAPFSVYGFRYDPEFEEFEFKALRFIESNNSLTPVELPQISAQDKRTIGSLCLATAFVDLKSHNELLVVK
jgi:hypothetical protein